MTYVQTRVSLHSYRLKVSKDLVGVESVYLGKCGIKEATAELEAWNKARPNMAAVLQSRLEDGQWENC